MTKPQEDVLVNEHGPSSSPWFMTGMVQTIASIIPSNSKILEAFKTGRGVPYDEYGDELNIGIGRHLGVWSRHRMIDWFCRIPGLQRKLEDGVFVADVGCGCGEALLILGRAFPNSVFHGYDISTHALKKAQQRLQEEGITNTEFFNSDETPLPRIGTYDFMYSVDVVHDVAHPDQLLKNIRGALKDNGQYLICDMDTRSTPAENIKEMASSSAFLYAFSVCVCLSSGLSDRDSMGLGTLGLMEVQNSTTAKAFQQLDVLSFVLCILCGHCCHFCTMSQIEYLSWLDWLD